jgi:hypothetical protein
MSSTVRIISTVALLAGGGATAEGFKWDVPETYNFVEVPSVQKVNGIPIRFNIYYSHWSVEQLANYFIDRFTESGLFMPPMDQQVRFNGQVFQLTAFDPIHRVSYTVMLKPGGERNTEVIAGEGYLADYHPQSGAGEQFAPVPPQAQHVVHTTTEGMRFMTFDTPLKAEEVTSFYRDVLGREGYTQVGTGTFRRTGQELTVRVATAPGGITQSVSVTLRDTPAH